MSCSAQIAREVLVRAFHDCIVVATIVVPPDVRERLLQLRREETNERAMMHLDVILENCRLAEEENRLICPDTGSILYYVRIGDRVQVEEGFSTLYAAAAEAVSMATAEGRLRPNMVHPITRENTKNNTGAFMPRVELRFDPAIDYLEILGVPKGGGSEIFGTFYRMLYPADGMRGVVSFVLECIKQSTFAGGTCPPNVIGIGLGGTADVCMKIAKEAAVLRPIGSRHPEPRIAEFEDRLFETIEQADIGPMGMGGRSSVLDVHVEYAVTHTAALPVAFNAQCSLCRRKVARVTADGRISLHDTPSWDYR